MRKPPGAFTAFQSCRWVPSQTSITVPTSSWDRHFVLKLTMSSTSLAGSGISLTGLKVDERGHQSCTSAWGPQFNTHPRPSHGAPVQSSSAKYGTTTYSLLGYLSTTRQAPDERSTWNLKPSVVSSP